MSLNVGGHNQITATQLVASIYDHIVLEFIEAKYPALLWRDVLPEKSIKSEVNPGAQNYVYRSKNVHGIGQFIRDKSSNIPMVSQTYGQVSVPLLTGMVGATLTDDQAESAQFGMQISLAQEFGQSMRRASDYHVERVFFFGDEIGGFDPFLDYPNTIKIAVGAPWDISDVGQMVADINSWLTAVWDQTNTVHAPDTVYLPPTKFAMLTTAYVLGAGAVGIAVSAMDYIKKNNIYTSLTGKELTIKPLRYLKGLAGNGLDRAIVMETNPENMVFPFPLYFQLTQPVTTGVGVDMFSRYKFGSFHMPFPKSAAYADGI